MAKVHLTEVDDWDIDNCQFDAVEISVLKYTVTEILHKAISTEEGSSTAKRISDVRKSFESKRIN